MRETFSILRRARVPGTSDRPGKEVHAGLRSNRLINSLKIPAVILSQPGNEGKLLIIFFS
jgi:hypothetical protein